jgi:hypothetical protein
MEGGRVMLMLSWSRLLQGPVGAYSGDAPVPVVNIFS